MISLNPSHRNLQLQHKWAPDEVLGAARCIDK
jgi:hypothetical protein